MTREMCRVPWCVAFAAEGERWCKVHGRDKELRLEEGEFFLRGADPDCGFCDGTGHCPFCRTFIWEGQKCSCSGGQCSCVSDRKRLLATAEGKYLREAYARPWAPPLPWPTPWDDRPHWHDRLP